MICSNCSKLSLLHSIKNCISCNSSIHINLCKLCESCSARQDKCAICLKNLNIKKDYKKCSSCGK